MSTPRIEPSREIAHRYDFALLCNARGLTGVSVEVGVDLGVFAKDFLSRWSGAWHIGIDPYLPYPTMGWLSRSAEMQIAINALMPFHGRFRIIQARSLDVAKDWPYWLERPDFVYIDGSHAYQDVRDDLAAWWEMLPPDGILAGHDYHADHPDVMRAVEDFARDRGLVVRLTAESEAPSFYIYRTEPANLLRLYFDSGEPAPNPHAGRC